MIYERWRASAGPYAMHGNAEPRAFTANDTNEREVVVAS